MAEEWHIVVCRGGSALRGSEAVAALDCVSEVYAPTRTIETSIGNRVIKRQAPWLGTLVLARWLTNDPHAWHDVADVVEVAGILGGWPPVTVLDAEVERFAATIKLIEDKKHIVINPPCSQGDWVCFTHLEIFYNIIGRCLWASAGVVGVRVTMLGRDHILQVPYEAVGVVDKVKARQYGRRRENSYLQARGKGL